jgi:hypothetical protein
MKLTRLLFLGIATIGIASFASGNRDLLYENNFNSPGGNPPLHRWGEVSPDQGVDGSGCLKFHFTTRQPGMNSIPLDAKRAAGHKIILSAMIRAENVGKPEKSYLGPKLMVHYLDGYDIEKWNSTRIPLGSYGYTRFSRMVRVPANVKKLELCIGLQKCTGTLWFDNVSVEILAAGPATENFVKPTASLQQIPQYRGAMISPRRMFKNSWKDLEGLSAWGANLVRYPMSPGRKNLKGADYLAWLDTEIEKLDACLQKCREQGMKLVIDLHRGPGMKKTAVGSNIMSWDPQSQKTLVEAWRRLARHYKGDKSIYAYDILNEPRESGSGYDPTAPSLDWYTLAPLVAKEIRKIDLETPIIISPLEWSNPSGFVFLKPYNIPRLIYTVHMYEPHSFTHQGVYSDPAGVAYPGKIAGKEWNKKTLRRVLSPVRDFQLKYNLPIFVGEFSAVRWAPGDSTYRYIKDCIELFEEYGWDWIYHAFREWDGWSVEHVGDVPRGRGEFVATTPRKELLLKYMKKNSR